MKTTQVEVWGESAQVRYDDDAVFLARFGDDWKIRSAGCTPGEGEAP